MQQTVLITGATGYIGGRLVMPLLVRGNRVRVLARRADRLAGRSWRDRVEIAEGDVTQPETLDAALNGIDTAYYLIHSLGGAQFVEKDRAAAQAFGAAAARAGVSRIIYLSGLGRDEADLSDHLYSRHLTGEALRESGVPVTEFRAAIIVGAGSISFELIRSLTERMPIAFMPPGIDTRIQPIGVETVLEYLADALITPESAGQIIEIGGGEVLTYRAMLQGYAEARSLRRLFIPLPILTPRLASWGVHLLTPLDGEIAGALIDSLGHDVVVTDARAKRLFPHIQPTGYRLQIDRALRDLEAGAVETSWSDSDGMPREGETLFEEDQGMMRERRTVQVSAPPEVVYRVCARIGGANGWLVYDQLWRLRARFDTLIGGVGFRRGRRHPDDLHVGDAFDFWRVEALEQDRLIRLRAEMRLPGRGWLEFAIAPREDGTTDLTQTAYYAPRGLIGRLYWWMLIPFHGAIFGGMTRAIQQRAEALAQKSAAMQPVTSPG